MKEVIKIIFFIILTSLIIHNTYKTSSTVARIHKALPLFGQNPCDISKLKHKIDILNYKPLDLINSNVVVYTKGGSGSGTVIKVNKTGTFILTAAHVIYINKIVLDGENLIKELKKAKEIKIKIKKKSYKASIVKIDIELDVAVLQINKILKVKPVAIADKCPTIGDTVWMIGNPNGTVGLINKGILSAIKKDKLLISTAGYYGNSGGMVLNVEGELIGVLRSVIIAEIGGFFPSLTAYNGVTRTKDLQKFLEDIL